MLPPLKYTVVLALALAAFTVPASAQHLHTNDHWDECAIVLSPNLTAASWRQFARELGLVTYFRPLASAKPLGRGNVEVALLQWGTRIDDSDAAWNDTFSHPDSAHYLFEGSALRIPGVMARVGITDRLDAGAYFTKAIGANYGFIGGQVQYGLLNNLQNGVAAAGRLSAVHVYGPEDMSATTFGADLVVSKDIKMFAPYAGVSGYMVHARETTDKVDLDDMNVFGAQAMVGVTAQVSALRVGAEYNFAKKSGTSFKMAFGI